MAVPEVSLRRQGDELKLDMFDQHKKGWLISVLRWPEERFASVD